MTLEELREIEDNTIMTWSTNHKGKQMKNVPASFLLWFNEQSWSNDRAGTKNYVCKRYNELVAKYRQETGRRYIPKNVVPPLVPIADQPVIPVIHNMTPISFEQLFGESVSTPNTSISTAPLRQQENLSNIIEVNFNDNDDDLQSNENGNLFNPDNDHTQVISKSQLKELIANAKKERIVIVPDKVKNVLIVDERAIEL